MTWLDLMTPETKAKRIELAEMAEREREQGKIIYPPQENIFQALQLTPPDKVKVCILAQDPYHSPGAANGLAFSVANGNPMQPSLRNIFKELVDDIGCKRPKTTDLTPWAKQGVLLLNSVLTVEDGKPNSHVNWGWQVVTNEILQICSLLPQPIVFIAWGKFAEKAIYSVFPQTIGSTKFMNLTMKTCLFSSHPSPFSASKDTLTTRAFFGSKPFSNTNALLKYMGAEPIDWSLP